MVNTILAKRVNHIVAKGDHSVWPKGAKSHGFSTIHKELKKRIIHQDSDEQTEVSLPSNEDAAE